MGFSGNLCRIRNEMGLSQEELGNMIGVTKSTISQWELGKAYPRRKRLLQLSDIFDVDESALISSSITKDDKSQIDCECLQGIRRIPFYRDVRVSAGYGSINEDEPFELVHIKDLPVNGNWDNLLCVTVSGDSMEPVLKDGSLVVIDTSITHIIDGGIYVFRQDDLLRVKVFKYNKGKIRVVSYNPSYNDEVYLYDEINCLNIVGKVVYFTTKLD
ncbi:XRE family transcriptional regulator [Photobacterium damselae]|uniref:XRE family transcriptional regulator n=1 Tax=Photobacterium damselae TaxID=38293 RepID=UPI0002B614BA|nr:XRE family transcriptional regulator [Photobacterium damselae]AGE91772.1 putative phage repressor [Photobacterium damselae subsp. piscicida DI21]